MADLIGTKLLSENSNSLGQGCFTNVRLPLTRAQPVVQEEMPGKYEMYMAIEFYVGHCGRGLAGICI